MAPGMSYSRLQNATPGSFVYFGNKAKSSSSAMSFLGAYSTKNRNSAKKTFPEVDRHPYVKCGKLYRKICYSDGRCKCVWLGTIE